MVGWSTRPKNLKPSTNGMLAYMDETEQQYIMWEADSLASDYSEDL